MFVITTSSSLYHQKTVLGEFKKTIKTINEVNSVNAFFFTCLYVLLNKIIFVLLKLKEKIERTIIIFFVQIFSFYFHWDIPNVNCLENLKP